MTNAIVASVFIIAIVLTVIIGAIVTRVKEYNKKIKEPEQPLGFNNVTTNEIGDVTVTSPKLKTLPGYDWQDIYVNVTGHPVPNMITKVEYKDGKR